MKNECSSCAEPFTFRLIRDVIVFIMQHNDNSNNDDNDNHNDIDNDNGNNNDNDNSSEGENDNGGWFKIAVCLGWVVLLTKTTI